MGITSVGLHSCVYSDIVFLSGSFCLNCGACWHDDNYSPRVCKPLHIPISVEDVERELGIGRFSTGPRRGWASWTSNPTPSSFEVVNSILNGRKESSGE